MFAIYKDFPSLREPNIGSTRLAVVAEATWMAHLPPLNRVPDPASRSKQPVSTEPVVEGWGIFMLVDLRRRSSRNWTSPNVLPTCTPPGCTSFCLLFQNVGPPDTLFYCDIFLGTPLAGVALQILSLARYRTSKAPVTPTAPIILISPMSTTASPTVVGAKEISPVIIRASPESGTRTTPRQGLFKA
jgi:hypothetical protein